ncbi:duf803 domain containing protein [Grosmannia clavigera kw1407]|uniref:Duf803 domain containing protein n=1 Tax=Grosmannia clavigera (strain kw1407 / UAMH 11150) TaxID=655863 RepID=F0XT78_GROCL|nr:duf803 domain containing protein [Grosmannia clavigera kw1407]EFW99302.1 duf803 domain containing protein [Grosmannia clavigera kw1407]
MTFPRGLSPGGSIALGIVVGVLSTSVQSLGLTLQRKSHILEDGKAPHLARRPPHRRRRWQLGMGLFLAANLLGSSVQISTLPLPVLSTLQASGLVFNSICATLILGEPFTRWSLWGTLLVCSGAVLIAIFGAIPEPAHNLAELLALLVRPAFVAWMAFQAVVVLALALVVELAAAVTPPLLAQTARFRLGRGLTYGAISGILSAHALLVAKSAVELVVRTVADGNNQFRHWQAWALVLVFVALALVQLYYLHRGLRLVSTSILYPLVFCVYNIVAILDGLIYFRQTDLIGPLRGCLITIGTAILLSGVFALSWRLGTEQQHQSQHQHSSAVVAQTAGDNDDEAGEDALLLGSSDIAIIEADNGDEADETQGLLHKKYVSSYHTFACTTVHHVVGDSGVTVAETASLLPPSPSSSPSLPAPGCWRPVPSSFPSLGATGLLVSNTSPTSRWMERAEIWGELEDQARSPRVSSGGGGAVGAGNRAANLRRHRSKTLPDLSGELPTRSPIHIEPEDDVDAEALAAYHRTHRRRRKSAGFPGFHQPRRTGSTGGLQDALGSVWRLGWWSGKGKQPVTAMPPVASSSPSLSSSARDAGDETAQGLRHHHDSPV